jgi:putative ABC transport system permease protein
MDTLWQDLRLAVRMALMKPGPAAGAALTLALGIAATSVIFASVSALVLRPLPFEDLERLVVVRETRPSVDAGRYGASPADFRDWREREGAFEFLAAYRGWPAHLSGAGDPVRLRGLLVTRSFFDVLGVKPQLGRGFVPEEDEPGGDRAVLLSYGLWKGLLGGDPAVIGRPLALNGSPATVVGVMPEDFDFPLGTDLWTPLTLTPSEWSAREERTLSVLGRLGSGTSLGEARAEMKRIAEGIAARHPETHRDWSVEVSLLTEEINFGTDRFVYFLMGAAVFLLLLACVNVASLRLAHAAPRQREVAVRAVLGATRAHLIRQHLTESVVLAIPGGLVAILFSLWGVDLMRTTTPDFVVRYIVTGLKNLRVDGTVLAFGFITTLLSGALAGLVPAWQGSRVSPGPALKEGREPASRAGRRRFESALVVGQVTLALVLLVGATLMTEGFRHLATVDRGFSADDVLTMRVELLPARYPGAEDRRALYGALLDRLSALPAVDAVALAGHLPAVGSGRGEPVLLEGRPAADAVRGRVQVISEGYFEVLDLPLSSGRAFTALDHPDAPPVAIVSRELARRLDGDGDPSGRRVRIGSGAEAEWRTIVGIAGDVSDDWLENSPEASIYLPYQQEPLPTMSLLQRTSVPSPAMAPLIRREVRALDPDLPLYDLRWFKDILSDMSSGIRLAAVTMGAFALVAFLLSVAGVYSTVSHAVSQRTHEIGVRMAVGAERRQILDLILAQGFRLAAIGVGLGLALAFLLGRLLGSFLFGVLSVRAETLIILAATLLAVAMAASFIPARRASRMDPMQALRYE